jgi:hypothetical protein
MLGQGWGWLGTMAIHRVVNLCETNAEQYAEQLEYHTEGKKSTDGYGDSHRAGCQ